MPGHFGRSPSSSSSSSSSGGGWSPGVQHSGMPIRRTTTTGGDGAHLRRKTTFPPKTKTVTPKDSKPSNFNLQNYLTGKHFGDTGNRQKLINAMKRGLIDERQYKLMSGYDASQEIGLTPLSTGLFSGIYNLGKSIFTPEDYIDQGTYPLGLSKIGPVDSTMLNVRGSKGQGFDMDQYSGIMGLSPESLMENPYLSNYPSKIAQTAGGAPAYDFANGGLIDLYRYGGFI